MNRELMAMHHCMQVVDIYTPVGKNGSADYCEGKLKINQSIKASCDTIINLHIPLMHYAPIHTRKQPWLC